MDFLSAKLIVNLKLFITPMFKLHEGHFIKHPKTNEYRARKNLCYLAIIWTIVDVVIPWEIVEKAILKHVII